MLQTSQSSSFTGTSAYSDDLNSSYPGLPACTSNHSTASKSDSQKYSFSIPKVEPQHFTSLPICTRQLTLSTGTSLNGTSKFTNHGQTVYGRTATVLTSTAAQNITEFIGDHRFPPIRPPINSLTTDRRGRPNQSASLAMALANCADTLPPPSVDDDQVQSSLRNIFLMLDSPKIVSKPLTSQ